MSEDLCPSESLQRGEVSAQQGEVVFSLGHVPQVDDHVYLRFPPETAIILASRLYAAAAEASVQRGE